MTGRDGGLNLVRSRSSSPQSVLDQRVAFDDLGAVPTAAVLLLEQHQPSGGIDPARPACIDEKHQRQKAGHLGFRR